MQLIKELTAVVNKLDNELSKEQFATVAVLFADIQREPVDKAQLFMDNGNQFLFIHKDYIHSAAKAELPTALNWYQICPDHLLADAIGVHPNMINNARRFADDNNGSFYDCFTPGNIDNIVRQFETAYSFTQLFVGLEIDDTVVGNYYIFYL